MKIELQSSDSPTLSGTDHTSKIPD